MPDHKIDEHTVIGPLKTQIYAWEQHLKKHFKLEVDHELENFMDLFDERDQKPLDMLDLKARYSCKYGGDSDMPASLRSFAAYLSLNGTNAIVITPMNKFFFFHDQFIDTKNTIVVALMRVAT